MEENSILPDMSTPYSMFSAPHILGMAPMLGSHLRVGSPVNHLWGFKAKFPFFQDLEPPDAGHTYTKLLGGSSEY